MTTEDRLTDEKPLASAKLPYHFRRFQPSVDVERLSSLFIAIEAVDQDDDHSDVEALREQLAWPGHDHLLDRWVVEAPNAPGELIGFASVWKAPISESGDTSVRVHPAWRRKGIGSELLSRMKERAREIGAASLGAYVNVKRAEADAFMRKRDFQAVSLFTRLCASGDLLRTVAEPVWPAGVQAHDYAHDGRIEALLTAYNTCFEGLWGYGKQTIESVGSWLPQYDPTGIFLAFDEHDRPVGMCRASLNEEFSAKYGQPVGYFRSPGVLPGLRSDPNLMYLPLTLTALRWLGAPNAPTHNATMVIMESWDDLPSTLALYQSLGFAITHQEHSYRWDVR